MNKIEASAGAELAVRELIAETRQFRDFARLSAEWFWEQDAEFRFVRFVGAGLPQPDIAQLRYLGKTRWEIAGGGGEAEGMAAHIAACMRHEEFRDFEYDLQMPDGGIASYSVSGTPLFDDNGGFIGYRGVGRDITALHQSRLAVLAHDAKLASIVDSSPLPTFVIDAQHRITHWNKACIALTGIPASAVVGTTDCWKGFYAEPRIVLANLLLDGADDAILAAQYAGRFRRSPLIPGAVEAEVQLSLGVNVWLQLTAAPLRDADGKLCGVVETIQDVTEQRCTAAELARVVDQYAEIFDNALIGICYQRNRVIERCNQRMEEIFGWEPGGLNGQSTRVLFASDEEWKAAGLLYAGGTRFDDEIRYRHKDGSALLVRVVGKASSLASDAAWVWTYEDVTQASKVRKAGERLFREQRMIFEQAGTGIMFARDRVIVRCNPAFGMIFGWPCEEMIGQSTRILFPSEEAWLEAGKIAGATMAGPGHFSGELRYLSRDGTQIWCKVKGNVLNPADPDEGAVWLFEDVTGQRMTEESLRQSNLELEARVVERTEALSGQLHFMQELIEAIPGPLFYKDRAGRYLGCNKAFSDYIGMSRDALIGRAVFEISPEDLARKYFAADEALFEAGGVQIYETRVKGADGKTRDVMFHKALFRQADDSVGGLIGVMLDISERTALEGRLRQWAAVFDSTADGVIIGDANGNIVAVNRAFTEITGYAEAEVLGLNPRFLQSGRHDRAFYAEMWDAVLTRGRWRGEIWNRRKDGSEFAERLTISPVTDKTGATTHFVAVFSDFTEIHHAQQRLNHQAHHDALTDLPNRLLLDDRIGSATTRARRDKSRLATLFVDLDRFKSINDTLGHDAGDSVLIEVARRLRRVVRESDTVARLGGDEFVLLLEDLHDPPAAAHVAEKVIDCLRQSIVVAGHEFFVGASIGISLYPDDGEDGSALLRNADVAMYRAKDRGRNTYEFFTADLSDVSLERFHLEVDIRHAIERNELSPYFQPQYALQSGALVGAEALIRWFHPARGFVSPATFIPMAEESGLIVPIGRWMLQASCRQWAAWLAAGFNPGKLSVNISGVEFRRGSVVDSVRQALATSGLAPQSLLLEITESAIMTQTEGSTRQLHALRALGVQLAIDDFGTGYSSLSYLKQLPLDKLKIDQSFVRGLPADSEDAAISRAVIALARSLQFTTVAEGVETEAQATFLREAGCDEMQGYLKSKPLPATEFESVCLRRDEVLE